MAENIKKQLEQIHITSVDDVVDILKNGDKDVPDEEWNDVLLYASKITGLSVETLLERIEEKIGYEYWLENVAEKEYQEMMGAEDTTYGCDPYSEY